jgi:hypothetical protein
MLAGHRRAHRAIGWFLATVPPLLVVAALATRPERPRGPLPAEVDAALTPDDRELLRRPWSPAGPSARRALEGTAEIVTVEGVTAPAVPEALVYAIACDAPAETTPSGPRPALLVGHLGAAPTQRFALPAAAPACVHLLFWDLFDDRPLGRLEVARAIEPGPPATGPDGSG